MQYENSGMRNKVFYFTPKPNCDTKNIYTRMNSQQFINFIENILPEFVTNASVQKLIKYTNKIHIYCNILFH